MNDSVQIILIILNLCSLQIGRLSVMPTVKSITETLARNQIGNWLHWSCSGFPQSHQSNIYQVGLYCCLFHMSMNLSQIILMHHIQL